MPTFNPRSTSEALRKGVQTFIRELWELDKPTVAAVNGTAVGPGAHLALACDFVMVHPGTRFVWSFAKWGLVVDAGGAYLLPRLVGLPRAKAMVMLGEGAVGEEAVELGLAYSCSDSVEALAKDADELAVRLAAGSDPIARAVQAAAERDLRDGHRARRSTARRTSRPWPRPRPRWRRGWRRSRNAAPPTSPIPATERAAATTLRRSGRVPH